MAASIQLGLSLSGASQPQFINGYYVTHNFLSTLGVRPMIGRDFLPQEDQPGTAPVVMLSYKLWQSKMQSDPNVVGRTIQLDDRNYTVIGVLPKSFYFLDVADLLAPSGTFPSPQLFADRGNHGDTDVIGRMAPGVKLPQVKVEFDSLASQLAQLHPETNTGYGVALTPIRDVYVSDTSSALLILFGAVMFVLLIACANVANLYLVRAAERTKEIAVRLAFGASRNRVVRQMLTESLLLAFLGGGLGALLGIWSLKGLERLAPAGTFMTMDTHIDGTVLGFIGAIVLFVSIAFGLVPALHATRPDVQEALKDGGRSSTPSAKQQRVRGALAIAETALALVLVVGAGLMLKSLYRLLQVSPGFQQEHVLTMRIDLPRARYPKVPATLNFWDQILDRIKTLPGVESAAVGTVVPFAGDHRRTDITIDGQPIPEIGSFPHPDYHSVSSGYFSSLKIPLLRGRAFTDADAEKAQLVGVINSTLAKRFWPNDDPIGKQFLFGHPSSTNEWIRIVGVVPDTKIYGLANPARLEVYVPYRQKPSSNMTLVIRSAADSAGLTAEVEAQISAVDKDQAVTEISTMSQLVDNSVSTQHATLVLLGIFSGLALVLASIGIYGMMAYSVAMRTHEIGIRIALGAQKRDVLRMVMGQGARLGLAGVLIGVLAALALTRLLSSLLFSVSAIDPLIFISVPVLLILVTLLACYIPAMRAMKVDPMVALRYE